MKGKRRRRALPACRSVCAKVNRAHAHSRTPPQAARGTTAPGGHRDRKWRAAARGIRTGIASGRAAEIERGTAPGRAAMALALPEPPWPASLTPLKVRGARRGWGGAGSGTAARGFRPRAESCRGAAAGMEARPGTLLRAAPYRTVPYRTVSYHTVPCRAVPPAGQSLARCRSRSRSPLSFQAVDDLLRCGICFDYFSIAVIIPQCSHNCKCGSARPLGSRPSRPAAPCPAQLCPCCVRGPGALRAALQAAACRQLWQKARGSTTRAEAGCHSGRSAAGSEDTFPSAPRSSQQRCSAASPRAIQGAPAKTRPPRGLTKPSAPFCG